MGRVSFCVRWLSHSRSANFSVIVCGGKSIYLGARGGRERAGWRVGRRRRSQLANTSSAVRADGILFSVCWQRWMTIHRQLNEPTKRVLKILMTHCERERARGGAKGCRQRKLWSTLAKPRIR